MSETCTRSRPGGNAGSDDERRFIDPRNNIGHRKGLPRASHAKKHLVAMISCKPLHELVDGFRAAGDPGDDDAVLEPADLAFGPPVLRPASFRDFYAFEQHVATMWQRRGGEIPEAWYRLPIFYFSNTSELRGPVRAGPSVSSRELSSSETGFPSFFRASAAFFAELGSRHLCSQTSV